MMKYKLLLKIVLIALLAGQNSFISGSVFDLEGDVFFDDLDDTLSDGAIPSITRSADDIAALTFFTTTIKLNNIISNSVYLKTNPVLQRTLDSLPNYIIYHSDQLNKDFFFNAYVLYNETFKQNFVKNSTDIGDYLNLDTQDFITKIDAPVQIDAPQMLELFQTGKMQERRLGILWQFFKNYKAWSFDATIPLNYQETNFYFSDSEQSIIQQEISKLTGSTSASVDRKFFEKLVVSDRIGFGNLKLKAGYDLTRSDYLKLKAGLVLTLPTSFAFAKGLLGSNFRKELNTPNVNLTQIYNLVMLAQGGDQAAKDELFAFGKEFSIESIQRLGAILLDQSLGNYHHPIVGGFFDSKIIYNSNVSLLVAGELLYSIPKHELRFFNQIKNPADFTTAAITDPVNSLPPGPAKEAAAAAAMNFLDVNTISTFFPTATNCRVAPGLEWQFLIGPRFENGPYLLHLGYNIWHTGQEKISNVKPIEPVLYPLNIADGTLFSATQQKVFIRTNYSIITPKHIWMLAICLDQTLGSSGIGKDFNAALELSIDF